jgi:hypothetical protein
VHGDPQRQVQARAVLAALEVADRLVVHAERLGQLALEDPALGLQHRDPVVDDLTAHIPPHHFLAAGRGTRVLVWFGAVPPAPPISPLTATAAAAGLRKPRKR